MSTILWQKVGSPRLNALASHMRKRQTRHEKILWAQLSGEKLGGLRFRRQVVMRGYVLDFYCDAKCLGIEVDGLGHCGSRGRDAVRDSEIFAATHVTILRFSNADVENRLSEVLETIVVKCGISNRTTFPQLQYQPNRYSTTKINTKSSWHLANVHKNPNVPEITELTVKACEQIVQATWKPRKAPGCNHAVYTSMEIAEQMAKNLKRWGVEARAERCGVCHLIYVLEAQR